MNRRQLLAMCRGNLTDGNDGVPVWLPEEKRVVRAAAKAGHVTFEQTTAKVGGHSEWRVRLVQPTSGYTDCACRDCMEIAISNDTRHPDLCNECEDAGCDATGASECSSPEAYAYDEVS